MSPATSRARGLRGVLVGACAALVTSIAHAAGGGGTAQGGTMMVLLLVCATAGAAVARVELQGRRARLAAIALAMAVGQLLGHLTLAAADHHHGGPALALPMLLAHAGATVALSVLVATAEHCHAVCVSVLGWLRLFHHAAAPAARRPVRRRDPEVIVRPVLLHSGLGMRAPPSAYAGV